MSEINPASKSAQEASHDVEWLCPHCEKPLNMIGHCVQPSGLVVCFCGSCKKVLGVTIIPVPSRRVVVPEGNIIIPS